MINKIDLLELMTDIRESELPLEFFDFLDVIDFGTRKYARNDWLRPNGRTITEEDMHASMLRHLTKSKNSEGKGKEYGQYDHESDLDHLLHLATRALMLYTLRKRKERNG